jgi:hypothetical protein
MGGRLDHPLEQLLLEWIFPRPEAIHRAVEQIVVERSTRIPEQHGRGGDPEPLENTELGGRIAETIEDHRLDELGGAGFVRGPTEGLEHEGGKAQTSPEGMAERFAAILQGTFLTDGQALQQPREGGGHDGPSGQCIPKDPFLVEGDGSELNEGLTPDPGPIAEAADDATIPASLDEIHLEVGRGDHKNGSTFVYMNIGLQHGVS